ncbi:MAG: TonB-dependent receptor [Opitutaceae bacterium]|jgi:TonB-dependent receptor|nr:TonB-dependent receptor [Opitutaceae bacterium]
MKTIIRIIPFLFVLFSPAFAQGGSGRIVVTVSDLKSGRYLQAANVELANAGRVSATDIYGVTEFSALAPGEYTVRVTYAGSNDYTAAATVTAGGTAHVSAALESDAPVELAAFVVVAERDGNAAAITRQKNALNVENIIAMDALGRLANDNPSELLTRLPGITSGFSTEGNADAVMVRGMSSQMTGITVDGAELSSAAAMTRAVVFTSIAASNFDEIQVTKAPTPNMSADRLGGRVNFKTKPAFEMSGKRGVSWKLGAKWSPSFFDYSPRRETPALTPSLSMNWRESFSVFGRKRNLGISANVSYNQNITQSVRTIARLDQLQDEPRFTYALERRDRVVDRQSLSGSVRVDYKFSKESLLNFTYNINTLRQYGVRPGKFIYDTTLTMNSKNRYLVSESASDGAIVDGSTEALTQVRARANTRMEIFVDPSGAEDMTHLFRLGGEHRLGAWKMDWTASHSRSQREQSPQGAKYNYAGTALTATLSNIGWTIDKSQSVDFPAVTQTQGQSMTDAANYKSAFATQSIIDAMNESSVGAANLARDFVIFGRPLKFSTGLRYGRRVFEQNNYNKTYNWLGVNGDKSLARFVSDFDVDSRLGTGALPVFDPAKYGRSVMEEHDAWEEKIYNTEASRRANDQRVEETICAGYVMGSMNIGPLAALAGVRYEKTGSKAAGYRRNSGGDSNSYDDMDEVNAAYSEKQNYNRSYDDFFPGVHLRYRLTGNLQARASLHTSIGRPEIDNLLPGFAVSSTEQRITINNPDIKPQYAYNFDFSLEYYMKPMGMITAGVFRKNLTDFIYSGNVGQIEAGVDYGFDTTNYIGWDLNTIENGARGTVDGIEIAYAQQLYFLPGPLRGLSVSANYTKLKTSGDYAGGNEYALPGFIPETANARLSYTRHPVGVYVQWSYRSDTPAAYAATPWLRTISCAREIWSAGISLKLPRNFEVYLDMNNLNDSPALNKRHGTGTRTNTIYNGPFVSCGIGGRF